MIIPSFLQGAMQRRNVPGTHRRPPAVLRPVHVPVRLDPVLRLLEARVRQRQKHTQPQWHEAYPQKQRPPKGGENVISFIHIPHPPLVNFACVSADDVRLVVRVAVHLDTLGGLDQAGLRRTRRASGAGCIQQLKLSAGVGGRVLVQIYIVCQRAHLVIVQFHLLLNLQADQEVSQKGDVDIPVPGVGLEVCRSSRSAAPQRGMQLTTVVFDARRLARGRRGSPRAGCFQILVQRLPEPARRSQLRLIAHRPMAQASRTSVVGDVVKALADQNATLLLPGG